MKCGCEKTCDKICLFVFTLRNKSNCSVFFTKYVYFQCTVLNIILHVQQFPFVGFLVACPPPPVRLPSFLDYPPCRASENPPTHRKKFTLHYQSLVAPMCSPRTIFFFKCKKSRFFFWGIKAVFLRSRNQVQVFELLLLLLLEQEATSSKSQPSPWRPASSSSSPSPSWRLPSPPQRSKTKVYLISHKNPVTALIFFARIGMVIHTSPVRPIWTTFRPTLLFSASDRGGSRGGRFPFFGGLLGGGTAANTATLQSLLALANQIVAGLTALIQAAQTG